MSVTLRPATLADLEAVTEVLIACWRENIAAVAPASAIAAITPERVRDLWSRALTGGDSSGAMVAESGTGTILGITRFQLAPEGTGIVHSLYVSPRAQRMGIGARLLSAAAEGLRELAAERLTLWVLAGNAPSIAFYRAQGWTPDGATRVQPEFGVDELRLAYTGPNPRSDSTMDNPLAAAAHELVGSGPTAPAGVAIGLRTKAGELTGVAGHRTLGEDPLPMTLDTRHDLASITKILATTTALIRLVSTHDVGLDDPVTGYLPGFRGDGKETVTVRQLLRHRGGLWEWQPLYLGGRTGNAAVRHAEGLPLRYPPGTERHYSDLGFILLGRIVEIVSGTALETAIRRLVTEPLGLADTHYARPVGTNIATSAVGQAIEQRMVATGDPYPVLDAETGFGGWRGHALNGEVNDGNAFHAFGGVSGHAGLFATLGDLLDYATALANYQDHGALWDPRVVESFLAEGPDPEQALGFRRYRFTVDGEDSVMYGHPGFVGCAVGFSPDAGVAVALCSNRLLAAGTPTPNDDLWTRAREAAAVALSRQYQSSNAKPSGKHEGDNE